jgi:hypothetical protein
MLHKYIIFRYIRKCPAIALSVLTIFLWSTVDASPQIHKYEHKSQDINEQILPYDFVPTVLPSNISKPQQPAFGSMLCLLLHENNKEQEISSLLRFEYPNPAKKKIPISLIYTQTVTSFL